MRRHFSLFLVLCCAAHGYLYAQDKLNLKYGKITPADFDLSKHNFDTSVSAVVIADVGRTDFEGNSKGGISLAYKRHTRIKILNKNGLDAADVSLSLYYDGNMEEKVNNIKATTYSLNDGKVTGTELDKKSIFKDKEDKNHTTVKFTLPAVKEGCIIEYSYTIDSDFIFNLQPWSFQGQYPVLWSQYEAKIPDFYRYVFLSQGTFPLEHTTENIRESYRVVDGSSSTSSSAFTFSDNAALHRWVARNVNALKIEGFTSTLRNHVSRIQFQLAQIRYPDSPVRDIMGNWATVAEKLMADEEFGAALKKSNGWLDDELKPVVANSNDKLEKAKKIYAYVRDRFTCMGNAGKYLSASLKTVDKNKNGYTADINLLLIAMLKQQDIEAYPVLLSTRSHGYTNEFYPILERFNYVICTIFIDNKMYYLDASEPTLGFNHLPDECYNGHARVVYPTMANPVYLSADSLIEKKLTSVFIRNEKPGDWEGHFVTNLGYYESVGVRSAIKSQGEEPFFKSIQSSYTGEWEMKEKKIDRLKELDAALKIEYDFSLKQDEDIIYFNPMMAEGYRENYFKSAERSYPVEMPYQIDETYVLSMDIPQGYVVEELPKSARVNFGDSGGFFEYMIDKTEGTIRLRSRLKLTRAYYAPEEYNDLREFYSYVVKKHAEPVVLKKKSQL